MQILCIGGGVCIMRDQIRAQCPRIGKPHPDLQAATSPLRASGNNMIGTAITAGQNKCLCQRHNIVAPQTVCRQIGKPDMNNDPRHHTCPIRRGGVMPDLIPDLMRGLMTGLTLALSAATVILVRAGVHPQLSQMAIR